MDPDLAEFAMAAHDRARQWVEVDGHPDVLEALEGVRIAAEACDGLGTELWLAELYARLERLVA